MKKVNFCIDTKFGVLFEEEFEFPDDIKDGEISKKFKEWYQDNIQDHADGNWEEL